MASVPAPCPFPVSVRILFGLLLISGQAFGQPIELPTGANAPAALTHLRDAIAHPVSSRPKVVPSAAAVAKARAIARAEAAAMAPFRLGKLPLTAARTPKEFVSQQALLRARVAQLDRIWAQRLGKRAGSGAAGSGAKGVERQCRNICSPGYVSTGQPLYAVPGMEPGYNNSEPVCMCKPGAASSSAGSSTTSGSGKSPDIWVQSSPVTIAPAASLLASGTGAENYFTESDSSPYDAVGALFLFDPEWGWAPTGPGGHTPLINNLLPFTQTPGVATTYPLQAPGYGAIVVPSTQLILDIPAYFDKGGGNFPFAAFEVEVQSQDPVSGQWNNVLEHAALLMGNATQINSPPSYGPDVDVTTVPGEGSYLWQVPVTLNQANAQVINTVRLAVFVGLWGWPDNEMNGPPNPPPSVYATFPSLFFDFPQQTWSEAFPSCSVFSAPPSGQGVFDGGTCEDPSGSHQWKVSPAFQIALAPTGLLATDVMPYTLVYLPPGDQSSESFYAIQTNGDTMSFTASQQSASQIGNTEGSAFTSGFSAFGSSGAITASSQQPTTFLGFAIGGSVGVSQQTASTETTISGLQSTSSTTETVTSSTTLSLAQCNANVASTPAPPSQDEYQSIADEPFWMDHFALLLHPVFAEWNYINPYSQRYGTQTFSAVQLIASVPSNATTKINNCYSISDLWGDAYGRKNGTDAIYPGSYPNPTGMGLKLGDGTTVSAQEVADIIKLDPFAAYYQWQGAPLDPKRFVQLRSPGAPPGIYVGIAPGTVKDNSYKLKDILQQTSSQSFQVGQSAMNGSGKASSTQSTFSASGSLSMYGFGAGGNTTNSSLYSQSSQQTITVGYSASQGNSLTVGTELDATVGDKGCLTGPIEPYEECGLNNLGQFRMPIYIFRDLVFGGVAFQDGNETNAPPSSAVTLLPE